MELRFQNPRDSFKCVNTSNDGCVTRGEVRAFFRTFNIPDETADRIFTRLDYDMSGLVAYQDFKDFVENQIKRKKLDPAVSGCTTPRPYAVSGCSTPRSSQPSNQMTST